MPTRSENLELIEKFPKKLIDVVGKLSDKQLDQKVVNWTVRQVVHHLCDSHVNSYVRVKLTLTENNPTIKPYDETLWPTLADYTLPISFSLEILKGVHAKIIHVLKNIKEDDWKRTFFHPEHNKSFTLESYLDNFASHGESHLQKIITSLQNKNKDTQKHT